MPILYDLIGMCIHISIFTHTGHAYSQRSHLSHPSHSHISPVPRLIKAQNALCERRDILIFVPSDISCPLAFNLQPARGNAVRGFTLSSYRKAPIY